MTDANQLPPLPEPEGVIVVGTQALRAFTAYQMRAYALQSRANGQATQPAQVTDEQILTEAARHLGEMHVENAGIGDILSFARAILALRPVQVPMTDDVVRDAERWRTFLATRPSNTHEGIIAAIDAASPAQKGGE